MNYTIKILKEDDARYTAQCVELPSAISFGNTIEDSIENVKEAIQLVIEEARDYEEEQITKGLFTFQKVEVNV